MELSSFKKCSLIKKIAQLVSIKSYRITYQGSNKKGRNHSSFWKAQPDYSGIEVYLGTIDSTVTPISIQLISCAPILIFNWSLWSSACENIIKYYIIYEYFETRQVDNKTPLTRNQRNCPPRPGEGHISFSCPHGSNGKQESHCSWFYNAMVYL